MREIKFRAWKNGQLMFENADLEDVAAVIKQTEIEGATVEQFTGLLDKNGKDIYEGDVVEFDTTSDNGFKDKGQVEREAVKYKDGLWTLGLYFNLPFAHRDYKLEVIGNIHENPDLLN